MNRMIFDLSSAENQRIFEQFLLYLEKCRDICPGYLLTIGAKQEGHLTILTWEQHPYSKGK